MRASTVEGGGMLLLAWCPGCDRQHPWWVPDEQGRTHGSVNWTWDGNIDSPTVEPSLLVHPDYPPQTGPAGPFPDPSYRPQVRCHSFLRAGVWDFLPDCEHHLAGQQVPMVDLPEWLST